MKGLLSLGLSSCTMMTLNTAAAALAHYLSGRSPLRDPQTGVLTEAFAKITALLIMDVAKYKAISFVTSGLRAIDGILFQEPINHQETCLITLLLNEAVNLKMGLSSSSQEVHATCAIMASMDLVNFFTESLFTEVFFACPLAQQQGIIGADDVCCL